LIEADSKCRPGENSHDYLESLSGNIDKLYWFDSRILKLYLELKTITAVSSFTGINSRYISEALARGKEDLKKMISKEVNEKRRKDLW
jgi:hypothetical protein